MDSNLSKANNMLIELELETWLLATEWLILKFSNGPLEKRTTHFFFYKMAMAMAMALQLQNKLM